MRHGYFSLGSKVVLAWSLCQRASMSSFACGNTFMSSLLFVADSAWRLQVFGMFAGDRQQSVLCIDDAHSRPAHRIPLCNGQMPPAVGSADGGSGGRRCRKRDVHNITQ